jgi:hypothetical protein
VRENNFAAKTMKLFEDSNIYCLRCKALKSARALARRKKVAAPIHVLPMRARWMGEPLAAELLAGMLLAGMLQAAMARAAMARAAMVGQ